MRRTYNTKTHKSREQIFTSCTSSIIASSCWAFKISCLVSGAILPEESLDISSFSWESPVLSSKTGELFLWGLFLVSSCPSCWIVLSLTWIFGSVSGALFVSSVFGSSGCFLSSLSGFLGFGWSDAGWSVVGWSGVNWSDVGWSSFLSAFFSSDFGCK